MAYEQAVTRAAADRSACETAMMTERQAKDLLRKQTQKMHRVEASVEKLIVDKESLEEYIVSYKSRQSDLQKELDHQASKVSYSSNEAKKLETIIDDKSAQVRILESRVKFMTKEHNETQKQKSHLEEKNNRLQAQLDQAHGDLHNAKQCTLDKDRLVAEIARSADLEKKLNELRQKSQQLESKLRANDTCLNDVNSKLRQNSEKQNRIVKTLHRKLQVEKDDWKARENHIISNHKLELQKLKNEMEAKVEHLKTSLETECKF